MYQLPSAMTLCRSQDLPTTDRDLEPRSGGGKISKAALFMSLLSSYSALWSEVKLKWWESPRGSSKMGGCVTRGKRQIRIRGDPVAKLKIIMATQEQLSDKSRVP